jgi:CBS-domain-containing membrane protein
MVPSSMLHTDVRNEFILTQRPESASELYRPSDSRFSAKLLPTFADTRCHVVSVMDPYGRILGFLDRKEFIPLWLINSFAVNN